MAVPSPSIRTPWGDFSGPNLGYVIELYEKYLDDPDSVDSVTRDWFHENGSALQSFMESEPDVEATTGSGMVAGVSEGQVRQTVAAVELAQNIREYGHRVARVNPLISESQSEPLLENATYELSEAALRAIPAHWVLHHVPQGVTNASEAIAFLRQVYTGPIGYDFGHVHDHEELQWLTDYVESGKTLKTMSSHQKKQVWERLAHVELFEKFLHKTFVGQKRFSIEGLDVLVPMLDGLVEQSVEHGTRQVVMGMAHRGRLNVLAHILRKPYSAIFSEFHAAPNKELVPSEGSMGINYGWTGDVKYHLGANRTVTEGDIVEARITLANNPSHLEFVNPVVMGSTRAAQDKRNRSGAPQTDYVSALSILVHGDAAFPGEGVVAETLNMSQLPGYNVGGTVHIIANNQLGFTAEAREGRSTRYASDLAKGFEIPIIHVNADHPEACMAVIELAIAYRNRFHKDFLIDLIGYRRWGHNEMDDPTMTQPRLYSTINNQETVRLQFQQQLLDAGTLSGEDVESLESKIEQEFKDALAEVTAGEVRQTAPKLSEGSGVPSPDTSVDEQLLKSVNKELLTWPEGFTAYPKLERILRRREQALEDNGSVDWAHAETLAFASILADGTPVRLTGQDSERGTFGQRHLVLHDVETGKRYTPLQDVSVARASFDVHNSPLSEAGVLGFEYGYDVHAPETLVLWEAQFGDFANAGQVHIDQFIASGRAKWGQESGLVLLLPHGYEGQGPEHSSGRLERYLQLCAERNWVVANVTTSAQYFHLLRRQALRLKTDPRPLVVMTPKSLLRNPKAASSWRDLVTGSFQRLLTPDGTTDSSDVQRLILCSGKVSIDLQNALEKSESEVAVAVRRVEQLYPFPQSELAATLKQYPNLKEVVWLQEEPRNMGAWGFVEPRIRALLKPENRLIYVGRRSHASPAEGLADVHQQTQGTLMKTAIGRSLEDDEYEF